MVKKYIGICAVLLLSGGMVFAAGQGGSSADGARSATIKLASLVPETSPWGVALNKMAANVKAETNGAVDIIVYHGGVAGGEADVLRKLRLNQIQAAILTSFGLNEITPEILALSCPFLIRSPEELDYVLEKLKPTLEADINRSGFQTIAWSKVGFVSFFSRIPVHTPAEMKKLKLGTSDTETTLLNVFKSMGYQLVPESIDQVLIDLNTGRVDAVYQEPLSAASFQLFTTAKYMMNFPIAPFMGGIFMTQTAWHTIPEQYQSIILKHAAVAETEIETHMEDLRRTALAMMVQNGLTVYDLTSEEQLSWIDDTEAAIPRLVGTMFDAEMYRRIASVLEEYRSQK
jgi:TRAP-type C4-dicarboxylate transport system substrate-binding protein